MLPRDRGGPVTERLVAVRCGGRRGSGYLLSPRIVLTAAHVVAQGSDLRVHMPGRHEPVRCERVWQREDPSCDAALLLAGEPLTDDDPDRAWNRWGRVSGIAPLPGCEAIGYPYVQRDGAGHLESEHVTGTLKRGSALMRQVYVIDIDQVPAPRTGGGSPWAGFSGAALFARGLLAGVVTADAEGWRHSRMKATPAGELLGDPSFVGILAEFGCPVPDLRDVSGPAPDPDAEFEERYAAYVRARHSRLTIYGVDLNHDREWPLDASYLSLEARLTQRRPGTSGWPGRTVPLPADQALSSRDRVLLRGVAGSGKTTLVQWLAVSAAGGRARGALAYLDGRVPFVLPLRHLARGGAQLPLPEGFLTAVGCPIAGTQPSRWTDRVLAGGRGLLLVDGIDEIPEPDRERTRHWLRDLIVAYPDNLWLVTSRPSAVGHDWLAPAGFAELALAPMKRDAVTEFVERWHTATGAGTSLARRLLAAVHTKQDLAALATNPLMCALICALHRDRQGYLPHGRKELYDAALSMLLERRDQQKGLAETIGVQLTKEPQIKLLQKLAYWMIRNQHTELHRSRAHQIVTAALPSVPQVARLGDAQQVLDHLLLRSGLLREPAVDAIDFVHRTFQDFLAARAAVEEGDFGLLADNADKTQWEDVIRMAVAHARPRECAALLKKLVELGDQRGDRRVHLLAMACLEHAAELDEKVRRSVEDRASRIIPPRTIEEADALIKVGPMLLELLPGPEGLTEWEAGYVLETAAGIAHDAALPLLARFCAAPWPRVRERVVDAWGSFDAARYAQEVIAHLPADDILTVRTPGQLAALRELGGRPRIRLRGDFDEAALTAAGPHPPGSSYELVVSKNSSLTGLGFLREWAGLRRLTLSNCPNIRSVDALAWLPDLEHLSAAEPGRLPVLQDIGRWPALRSLVLGTDNSPSCAAGWEAVQRHPALEDLTISSHALAWLPPRQAVTGLRRLALVGSLPYGHLAAMPGQFPNVSVLDLGGGIRAETAGVRPFPRFPALKQLIVREGTALTGLDRLSGVEIFEVP
ncbi:NACHT domain-containing protein [Streptomyces poonensis]|uniref:ATP-binding protein n=1 Tax=Streptomyces poonensis TaxID=68255 RepID=A0A918UKV8_9ACTN|nr:NACHT domain-containing protein [Streptomyces poonensis]GGZ19175.1 ATP-binding protein [Streptomyces poonensis]GLJ90706.1 ATP-binding protein [Streptomyces poonensis]